MKEHRTIWKCDLCGTQIDFPGNRGGGLVEFEPQSEYVHNERGERVDMCKSCCLIIHAAYQSGILDITHLREQIFTRLGFEDIGNGTWRKRR